MVWERDKVVWEKWYWNEDEWYGNEGGNDREMRDGVIHGC